MKISSEQLRNRAQKDLSQGQKELFKKLQSLDPAELSSEDMAQISRLSSEERQRLFKKFGNKPASSKISRNNNLPHKKNSGSQYLYKLPAPIRRLFAALMFGCLGVSLYPTVLWAMHTYDNQKPVSRQSSLWPACGRLSPSSDACVYSVRVKLTWPDASRYLEQPIEVLKNNNNHINSKTYLSEGDALVVWRSVRTLEDK